MVVQALAEADGLEQPVPAPLFGSRVAAVERSESITFCGRGERVEQVVGLEDVADVPADRSSAARCAAQLLAEDPHAALLRRAQRADQRQHRRLARARGPGHDDDLAGAGSRRDVEQICRRSAPAVEVVDARRRSVRRRAHQKISAGSAAHLAQRQQAGEPRTSRASARRPTAPRSVVISSGSRVAPAATHRGQSPPSAGQEAEHRQDHRLLDHDAGQEAVAVSHRLQRRVLGQVVVHVGEQDLVDDDACRPRAP